MYSIKELQKALKEKGFDPGVIDGIMGPNTELAIVNFKASVGLKARAYVGPKTAEALGIKFDDQKASPDSLPWMEEITKYMGYHERTDNKKLKEWLRSDGGTLGDPSKLPWCGDAVHTAYRNTLPKEKYPGRLGINPYLARNWELFGEECEIAYGAAAVCWRGKRNGTSGHICFVVGYDPRARRVRIRGGNQSNKVCDAWISLNRVLSFRKPKTWKKKLPPVPIMNSAGAVLSTNEA